MTRKRMQLVAAPAGPSEPPPAATITFNVQQLSAAALRQLLSEAEQREAAALQLERERLQVERRARLTLADDVPDHLRSIARQLPAVMTADQAARVLGVCTRTVRRWAARGLIISSAPSDTARLMFTRDAVVGFLANTSRRAR